MDTLTSMRVFQAVVEAGSFAAAADQLALSRGMVTKHVASLEQQLGVRLLHRTTRRLTLTEVGADYLARVTAILTQVDEAALAASSQSNTPAGTIRMTAGVDVGQRRLGHLLAAFRQVYPRIDVDLTLSNRHVDLLEEGFDLALRTADHAADERLVGRKVLGPLNNMVVASPAYLDVHGRPRTPAELRQHNCLFNRHQFESNYWTFGPSSDPVRVPVNGSLSANNNVLLIDAARAGLGVVMQPQVLVAEDVESGRLVELLPDWEKASTTLYALYPERRFLPQKVRVFIDFLMDYLSQ